MKGTLSLSTFLFVAPHFFPPLIPSPHPLPTSFHPSKTSLAHHVRLSTAAAGVAPVKTLNRCQCFQGSFTSSGCFTAQWEEKHFSGPVLPWVTRSSLSFRCAEDRFQKDPANDGAGGGAGPLITAVCVPACTDTHSSSPPRPNLYHYRRRSSARL